jgi:hypothetical protein
LYKDFEKANGGFDATMTMDDRRGGDHNQNKSLGRTSNSKIIMAKQFFETINKSGGNACNMPRQFV